MTEYDRVTIAMCLFVIAFLTPGIAGFIYAAGGLLLLVWNKFVHDDWDD